MAAERAIPWERVSAFVADVMGLHFPPERWPDLQRGLAGAAKEFGFENLAECAHWLLASSLDKPQIEVLASHLTIGETYFFREPKTFEAVAQKFLPGLIRQRRGREQRLRFWSAACCTGEEAYSLAILLHEMLPDLPDWHVTILGTDINSRFLRKAVAGSYREWSFRDAPQHLKECYFDRAADGSYVVVPEIRRLATFAHLNLVEDTYPSLATDTNAMDLIFCRNALMYFTPTQTRKVIRNLHRALVHGGWLAVSPSETSQQLFSHFVTRNFPGAILYEKSDAKLRQSESREAQASVRSTVFPHAVSPISNRQNVQHAFDSRTAEHDAAPLSESSPISEEPPPLTMAASRYEQGRYAEAAQILLADVAAHAPDPQKFSLLARALANQGRLADALAWCDRWIAADKLDSAAHYFRAVVLLEQGDAASARQSLQRAIYLQPDFVLAHFALGNVARSGGANVEADKHFANALHLLTRRKPDDILPESDGLTAGRLAEIINTTAASVGETR